VRGCLVLLLLACACEPPRRRPYLTPSVVEPGFDDRSAPLAAPAPPRIDPATAGHVVERSEEFKFDGGAIDFELRQDGHRLYQLARNRYAVPIMLHWQLGELRNLVAGDSEGTSYLPAADAPNSEGRPVVLAVLDVAHPDEPPHRELSYHARFGDPEVQAAPYGYALPYGRGRVFAVLQGFHGAFSHRGSNEYAIDFDCPVATPVLAARPGLVVASNANARGAGTTAEYLDPSRVNFVLIRHDDGTLGEYMHLAPSGVVVKPGQRVRRGQELALSGNTGFSSTPHLHFQVMTAADDGIAARSFPFLLAVGPGQVEQPVQGRSYASWE